MLYDIRFLFISIIFQALSNLFIFLFHGITCFAIALLEMLDEENEQHAIRVQETKHKKCDQWNEC